MLACGAGQAADLGRDTGSIARIGVDLNQLYQEHRDYLAMSPVAGFRSANPLVRVRGGSVVIDAVAAAGDPNELREALVALGMRDAAVYGRYVSGMLPISALPQAAGLAPLRFVRPAWARHSAGSVTSQGDQSQASGLARSLFAVSGAGIVVGTLSDSYNCLGGAAADVASGDLPSGVIVLAEEPGCTSGTDEGRAMMQIVRDVAPGAGQAFHTAFGGTADFASGIGALASAAGARVINDDVIYYAEPMFQDGVIAQAVNNVTAAGIAYFSAAGNQARQSYEATFAPVAVSGTTRHDFDPGPGVDTRQKVTIPGQSEVTFVLQWDQPFYSVSGSPGSASDLDITLYSQQGAPLAGGVDSNIGGDPVEVFSYKNTSSQPRTYQLGIRLKTGPAPGAIKYVYFGDLTVNEFATNSAALYGHANAAGGMAVAAARYTQTPAFGVSPPLRENFSSAGGTPIRRDQAGNPVFELRQKPDITAPDGGDNTFFGSDYEANGYPNFFGTSAAAPHAAGVAALVRSFDPALSVAQVYTALRDNALDMDAPGPDFDSGAGLVQADQALLGVVPPLAVATAALPGALVGAEYLQALGASGGLAPYSWLVSAGTLPPGLTLAADGLLSGTFSSAAGSPYTFTVQVTDSLGHTSTRAFTILVFNIRTCGSCH